MGKQLKVRLLLGLCAAIFVAGIPARADAFSLSSLIAGHRERMQRQYEVISRGLCSVVSSILPFSSSTAWCTGNSERALADGKTGDDPLSEGGAGMVRITEVHVSTELRSDEADSIDMWVEVFNGGKTAVNLSGWVLASESGSTTLPMGTALLPEERLILSKATTTFALVDLPATTLLVASEGDVFKEDFDRDGALYLEAPDSTLVDALSWGANGEVFTAGTLDFLEGGGSLVRLYASIDTDSPSDWAATTTPSPGW